MATDQCSVSAILRLPITGRCGDRRVLRSWALVADDDAGRLLLNHSWSFDKDGYPSRHNTGAGKCTIYLHHVVFEKYHGTVPSKHEIDHIDRNKLNALPDNLRAVRHSRNIMNVGKRRDNTSGYVGVHWYSRNSRWGAAIHANRKRYFLGLFDTPQDAALAVNAAYAVHHPCIPPPNTIRRADGEGL